MSLTSDFLRDYNVPEEFHSFWNSIEIKYTNIPAAGTDSVNKIVYLNPNYNNTGVLAHEFCHISYSFLSKLQTLVFTIWFGFIKLCPKIRKMFQEHPYGQHNVVEGYADLYRYRVVPSFLKRYYPKLF